MGRSLALAYEKMGVVMLASIALYFAALATFFAVQFSVWGFGLVVVLVGPLWGGLMYVGNLLAHKEDAGLADFVRGYARFWLRSAAIAGLQVAVGIVLYVDIQAIMASKVEWLRYLAGVWAYLAIFAGLVFMYACGVMAEQDVGLRKAIRRSVILILDNLAFTLTIGVFEVVIIALGALPTIGMIAGFKAAGYFMILGLTVVGGMNAIYLNLAAARVLARYDAGRVSDREKLERELQEEQRR